MCDRVVLIDAGKIVADSTVADLEQRFGDLDQAFESLTIGAGTTPVAASGESHDA